MAAFPSQMSTPGELWRSISLERWSVPWRMWKTGSFFFRDLNMRTACLGVGVRARLDADLRTALLVVDRQDKKSRSDGVLLLGVDGDEKEEGGDRGVIRSLPARGIGDIANDDESPQSLCQSPTLSNVSTVKL